MTKQIKFHTGSSDPGLSKNNPDPAASRSDDGRKNCSGSRDLWDSLGMATSGVSACQLTPFGSKTTTTYGKGYLTLGVVCGEPGVGGVPKLRVGAQVNPNSALAVVGSSINCGPFSPRIGYREERRGDLTAWQCEGKKDPANRWRRDNRKDTNQRVIEWRDYEGRVYNFLVPHNSPISFMPYCSGAEVTQRFRYCVTSPEAASSLLAEARVPVQTASNVLMQKVKESVTDIHTQNEGDIICEVAETEQRAGANISFFKVGLGDLVYFTSKRRHRQAENLCRPEGQKPVAELLLSKESGNGWSGTLLAGVGLQASLTIGETTSCCLIREYDRTPAGLLQLNSAPAAFDKQPMPSMDAGTVTKAFLGANSADADVRMTGAKLSQETYRKWVLAWRLHLLFVRPGFWEIFKRERLYTKRRELDFKRDSPHVIDRLTDICRTDKVDLNGRPTVYEVAASEEWVPSERDDGSPRFVKMRFVAKWRNEEPWLPSDINLEIDRFEDWFGKDVRRLDASPMAIKTTRNIKFTSDWAAADIERFATDFDQDCDWEAAAKRANLSIDLVRRLKQDVEQAQTLNEYCTILRQFVGNNGFRAVAFVHDIKKDRHGTVELSADVGLFNNAVHYSELIAKRYDSPIAEPVDICAVKDRVWDVSKALRAVFEARGHIAENTAMSEAERTRQNRRLKTEEDILRALLEPVDVASCEAVWTKLTDRRYMTQLDCEFAAPFYLDGGEVRPFEGAISDRQSALAFLRHYDKSMQQLRRIQSGISNNILLTDAQQTHRATRTAAAIAALETDYNQRRSADCEHARRWLARPWSTFGYLWFTSLTSWRFLWKDLSAYWGLDQIQFWPATALLGL